MLLSMSPLLQIKDVPEDVHRTLKSRAALAGVSLTEYARRTLVEAAARPSREELRAELAALPIVTGLEAPGDALRRTRDDLA